VGRLTSFLRFSPDYEDRFEVAISRMDARTAEQWFRTVFEDAPHPLRWFLLLGWRGVLGLHLGPRPSPDYILGWRIAAKKPEEVRLELHSAFMQAQLTLRLSSSLAVWRTHVLYTHPLARPLWAVAGVIHRRLVPYLLRRAASLPPYATLSGTD
jgi:hypothetical protein